MCEARTHLQSVALIFHANFARIFVGTLLATRWTVGMLEN